MTLEEQLRCARYPVPGRPAAFDERSQEVPPPPGVATAVACADRLSVSAAVRCRSESPRVRPCANARTGTPRDEPCSAEPKRRRRFDSGPSTSSNRASRGSPLCRRPRATSKSRGLVRSAPTLGPPNVELANPCQEVLSVHHSNLDATHLPAQVLATIGGQCSPVSWRIGQSSRRCSRSSPAAPQRHPLVYGSGRGSASSWAPPFGPALYRLRRPSPQAVSAHSGHDTALSGPRTPTRRHGARPRYGRALRLPGHSGAARSPSVHAHICAHYPASPIIPPTSRQLRPERHRWTERS